MVNEVGKIAEMVYKDLVARGKRLSTAKEWRAMVLKFEGVCGEKDSYNRNDIIDYVAKLREDGLCQNTINTQLRPIKLVWQILEIERKDNLAFPKLSMEKVRSSDVKRTMFERGDIVRMIAEARVKLSKAELSYLCLATMYGLRREELASLSEDEVRKGESVKVGTVKGGVVTTHLIPVEVKDYLKGYKATRADYMTLIFRRIMSKLGMKFEDGGYGWHSIRRALATELLLADVSGLNILRFMRWSDASVRGEFGMLALYAKRVQSEVDLAVFKSHPFLKYWK